MLSRTLFLTAIVGLLGAVVGASVLYASFLFFGVRASSMAAVAGICVGFVLRTWLRKRKIDITVHQLVTITATCAVIAIMLANFFLWFFFVPGLMRQTLQKKGYSQKVIQKYTDDYSRRVYPFNRFMKHDLFEQSTGHDPVFIWFCYLLAVYAAVRVSLSAKK